MLDDTFYAQGIKWSHTWNKWMMVEDVDARGDEEGGEGGRESVHVSPGESQGVHSCSLHKEHGVRCIDVIEATVPTTRTPIWSGYSRALGGG